MKLMDLEFRSKMHKNYDHFHLVEANKVYPLMPQNDFAGSHLTATIYSEDSNDQKQLKEKKNQYAQILVDQIQ